MKIFLSFILSIQFCFGQITADNKHWLAGSLISGVSGSVAHELGVKPIHASIIGFGLGTLAGIMKESVWDRGMDKGTCDNKDAFTTGWGALFGSLTVVIYVDRRQKEQIEIDKLIN